MKAILVIDIDDDIVKSSEGLDNISVSYDVQTIVDSKTVVLQGDVDVPLKPLPKRKRKRLAKNTGRAVMNVIAVGWNACLDEILGEQNADI